MFDKIIQIEPMDTEVKMIRFEDLQNKINGLVYGSALGDAWGYKTEFQKFDSIKRNPAPIPEELVVSDDTQMSIYTIKAIEELFNQYSIHEIDNIAYNVELQNFARKTFAKHYSEWYSDPRNNRAPGTTCIQSLQKYIKTEIKLRGNEGSWGNNKKGCGTIMRAPWIGALPLKRETIAVLSILQSETTHAHPTAGISSAVASLMVNDLFNETYNLLGNDEAFRIAFKIVEEIKRIEIPLVENSLLGIQEVENTLIDSVNKWELFFHSQDDYDMNVYFGEGWIAEEALANSIASVSLYSPSFLNNSLKGVQRLVYTNGDSDSIASIGGAFLGVYNGYNSFDYHIKEDIEEYYKSELKYVSNFLIDTIKDNVEIY